MFLFAFWIHVVGELFDIYWQKKKLGKLVTAMISRGLIALTPLWHFLCRRQCDYPTSIVPGFHAGKQLKFTRNQIGKEYTTSTEHPNSKQTPFCPLMVLTMTRTNQGWNYRILQVKINVQQIRWLWTMGSLFPSKKRVNICGIKLITVKGFPFIWVTFGNGNVKQNIAIREISNCNTSI